MPTVSHADTTETTSARLGAAIRDQAIPAFIGMCYARELADMAKIAPAIRPMVSEPTYLAITDALYARTGELDAAADRCKARGMRGHRKFTELADASQAAQVAWTQANMAFLRTRREARA
jgi:hypothetical protein